jgi:membrane-associated phospholipid phosphatase
MVRDIWSRRWSLPGGEGQAGETQRQTAQRTTQQQIGLDVRVGRYLGAAARGVGLFVCEPPEHSLPLSGNLLLLPAAARMATLEAQLLDAPSLPRSAWRYASQAAPTVAVLQNLPQALPLRLVPSTEPGNRLFAAELQGIRWLQSLGTPPVHHAMRMASYLGSERAMLFVAAALWALRGRFRGAEVIFVLSTACLLGCLAKQACALPRPCYLDAALQLDPASSFGFPSGHTVVATTLAALFAWRTPRPLLWGCAAAVALCTGLARTYLGVHFFHDVLGGWCLAAAGLGLHAVAVRRYADRFVPVRLWALLGAGLSVVALALQPQPTPIVFSSLLLGLCTGLTVFTLLPLQPRAAVVQLLLFAAGIYLSDAITHLLRPAEATTALCALHLAARFFFLGLLLPLTHACCQALQRLSQRSGETAAL